MKETYDIFIPEKGGAKDIVLEKYEYDWGRMKVQHFPVPLPLNLIEVYVDEEGVYHYENFNMLGFDFMCEMALALKDLKYKEAINRWMFRFPDCCPFGPVGIKVHDKKIRKELVDYFTERKRKDALYDESDGSTEEDDEIHEKESPPPPPPPPKKKTKTKKKTNSPPKKKKPAAKKKLPVIKKTKTESI
jgi:hypothetical protein